MTLGILSYPEKTQFVPCIVKVWGMRRRAGVHPSNLGAQPVLPQPLSILLIFCHIKDFFPVLFWFFLHNDIWQLAKDQQSITICTLTYRSHMLCCARWSIGYRTALDSEQAASQSRSRRTRWTHRLTRADKRRLRGGRPNLLTSSFDQSTRQHEG